MAKKIERTSGRSGGGATRAGRSRDRFGGAGETGGRACGKGIATGRPTSCTGGAAVEASLATAEAPPPVGKKATRVAASASLLRPIRLQVSATALATGSPFERKRPCKGLPSPFTRNIA